MAVRLRRVGYAGMYKPAEGLNMSEITVKAVPPGLEAEDVFNMFKQWWNTTEWTQVSRDKIQYYLANYSKVPIPANVNTEAVGTEYFNAVRKELVPASIPIKDDFVVDLSTVGKMTVEQIWGKAPLTARQMKIQMYRFIKGHNLVKTPEVASTPDTTAELIAKLPPELQQVVLKELAAKVKPPVETPPAPPKVPTLEENTRTMVAGIAGLSADEKEALVKKLLAKAAPPVQSSGEKKKKGKKGN